MQVGTNTVVSIDYTLKDDAGVVLDTSQGAEPLSYVHGVGAIIPGLEAALAGKGSGDRVQVTVAPDEAYGQRDLALIQTVARDQFRGAPDIEVGMQFEAQGPGGGRIVTVVNVEGDRVTLDANHPLAGKTLHFDVEVKDVRQATADELQHGHAHGAGGHHH
jgi:FKBP-type peptidyl-prolyl cis-trans isomerase SlyD